MILVTWVKVLCLLTRPSTPAQAQDEPVKTSTSEPNLTVLWVFTPPEGSGSAPDSSSLFVLTLYVIFCFFFVGTHH